MGLYDYYPAAPQGVQQPDILGNYLRGAMAGPQMNLMQSQAALAQGQLAMMPLEMEQRQLGLEQLRFTLGIRSRMLEAAERQQAIDEGRTPAAGDYTGNGFGAGAPSYGTAGGIQSGPQGAVGYRAPQADITQATQGTQGAPPAPASTYGGGGYSGISPGTAGALRVMGMSPEAYGLYMGAMGEDPVKAESEARTDALQRMKIQTQPLLDTVESVRGSQNPAAMIVRNPGLLQAWQQVAPQMGIRDPAGALTAPNGNDIARQALGMVANNVRGMRGEEAKDYALPVRTGAYGAQYDPVTGKRVSEPVFSMETPTVYGRENQPGVLPIIKSPFIPGGISVGGASAGGMGGSSVPGSGTAGSTQAASRGTSAMTSPAGVSPVGAALPGQDSGLPPGAIPTGFEKQGGEDRQNAGIARDYYGGLQKLRQLETDGYRPPTAAVVELLDEAAAHQGSLGENFLSQWRKKYTLGEKGEEYLQALVPVLQGAGASLTKRGATNPDAWTSNFHGLVPLSGSLGQVDENRNNTYLSLLSQAGPGLNDRAFAQQKAHMDLFRQPGVKFIGSKAYRPLGNGRWEEAGSM